MWEKRIQNWGDNEEKEDKSNNDEDDQDRRTPPPLVISVGQVVPHEVLGMANFNKNLFMGVRGVEAINLSHFIGAIHGIEKLMGRGRNPLRSIASKRNLQDEFDLWYILTVMGTDDETGEIIMRGLLRVNFNLLDCAPRRVVVYLNEEYCSMWLGNKSIHKTRMAINDRGGSDHARTIC
ncbi:LOW QUALITY PROTEIN: hypothetical protein ACHAW5_000034 [Stephanodiscus triporus]|uniref:DNA-directed RNA polymerase n=1 Tax=Stephanodiscus triporus TaxID=2934178 RepID=A0ABD3PG10_9STRA